MMLKCHQNKQEKQVIMKHMMKDVPNKASVNYVHSCGSSQNISFSYLYYAQIFCSLIVNLERFNNALCFIKFKFIRKCRIGSMSWLNIYFSDFIIIQVQMPHKIINISAVFLNLSNDKVPSC